jgi:hypothetical protein
MTAKARLTSEEFAALQEVGKVMQRIILPAHRERLLELKYVMETPGGGLVLTDTGRLRLTGGR